MRPRHVLFHMRGSPGDRVSPGTRIRVVCAPRRGFLHHTYRIPPYPLPEEETNSCQSRSNMQESIEHLCCACRSSASVHSDAAVSQALAMRKEQVKSTQSEIEEAEKSQRHPFPTELTLWTVDDVCRWLDTLQLGEYKQAFREGKVRGRGNAACCAKGCHTTRRFSGTARYSRLLPTPMECLLGRKQNAGHLSRPEKLRDGTQHLFRFLDR